MEQPEETGRTRRNCQSERVPLRSGRNTVYSFRQKKHPKPDNKVLQCIRMMITKPQNSKEKKIREKERKFSGLSTTLILRE